MNMLGAALLAAAGLMGGVLMAAELRERARQCRSLCRMLSLLEFELERFRTPLPELFESLAGQLDGQAGALCRDTADALACGREPFCNIWPDAVRRCPRAEREILAPLGSVLGRYGAEEQLAAAADARGRLERLNAELEAAVREKSRVYIGLCTAGGLMLAVLLI